MQWHELIRCACAQTCAVPEGPPHCVPCGPQVHALHHLAHTQALRGTGPQHKQLSRRLQAAPGDSFAKTFAVPVSRRFCVLLEQNQSRIIARLIASAAGSSHGLAWTILPQDYQGLADPLEPGSKQLKNKKQVATASVGKTLSSASISLVLERHPNGL